MANFMHCGVSEMQSLILHSTAFVVAGHFDDALGKKFEILAGEQCFDGIITSYDGLKGKFGVYFPSDGQTIDT